jgi:uncharacterized protein YhfF/GNAT superfamily N-acetyltransferase
MVIERIENHEVPYRLLFLADESEEHIKTCKDTAIFWAAREENEILGIIGLLMIDKQCAEIVNIAVHEEHQNKRIGTELLEKAIAWSDEQGYRDIIIKTGNSGIRQLYVYQRCGFRFDAINKDYFSHHYPLPIYENDIKCLDQIVLRYRIYSRQEKDKIREAYWNRFLEQQKEYAGRSYEVWNFCQGEYLPNKLLGLVKCGKKTATSSALELYGEDEKLPEVGGLSIITYGNGLPGCIVETREIRIKQFNEISADEARLEGEGDLSLDYWRQAHEWFFRLEYKEAGKTFSEEIPVIFERFQVIYDEDLKG